MAVGLITRMSHKFSTTFWNTGTGADFFGFATLQGVDPASPANLFETRASTRSPFARDEFCETCGINPIANPPGVKGRGEMRYCAR